MVQEAKSQLRSAKDWGDFNKRNGIVIGIELISEAVKSLNYQTEGEKEDARSRIDGGTESRREEGGGRTSFFSEVGESYLSDLDEHAKGPAY